MKIWRIRVYEGTGNNKTGDPRQVGYVCSRKPSHAIIFAQEALRDSEQSLTLEMEIVEPELTIQLDRAYEAKWSN